jgi:hypothetical protein
METTRIYGKTLKKMEVKEKMKKKYQEPEMELQSVALIDVLVGSDVKYGVDGDDGVFFKDFF